MKISMEILVHQIYNLVFQTKLTRELLISQLGKQKIKLETLSSYLWNLGGVFGTRKFRGVYLTSTNLGPLNHEFTADIVSHMKIVKFQFTCFDLSLPKMLPF